MPYKFNYTKGRVHVIAGIFSGKKNAYNVTVEGLVYSDSSDCHEAVPPEEPNSFREALTTYIVSHFSR